MQIESIALDKLVLDPANARKHATKNLEAIKGSLAKFGQQKPIVVGKGDVVIAGNGTLEAARALGWDKIDVVRTKLEGPEAIAFAIADNRTGELAEWDAGVLSETLKSLKDMDFDLGAIGFDAADLAGMIATPVPEGLTDPDEVPNVVPAKCKIGDLYTLGNHRLLCGDSTNIQHVERLMGGEKADMVFTDPPYGIDYQDCSSVSGITNLKGNKYRPIENDETDFDISPLLAFFDYVHEMFIWGGDYLVNREAIRSGSMLVWDKRIGNQDSLPGSHFEICWSKQKHQRRILRYPWVGVMAVDPGEKRSHPTQKCIKMIVEIVERWGKPGEVVVDLFLGSGSTLIACEKTGRRCFGMEIDPHYCSVILARWENFTGKTAVRLDGA